MLYNNNQLLPCTYGITKFIYKNYKLVSTKSQKQDSFFVKQCNNAVMKDIKVFYIILFSVFRITRRNMHTT